MDRGRKAQDLLTIALARGPNVYDVFYQTVPQSTEGLSEFLNTGKPTTGKTYFL